MQYFKTLEELEKYMETTVSHTKIPNAVRQDAQDLLDRRCHYLLTLRKDISFQAYVEALFSYWCRLNNISVPILCTSLFCAVMSGDIRVKKAETKKPIKIKSGYRVKGKAIHTRSSSFPSLTLLQEDASLVKTGFTPPYELFVAPSLAIFNEISPSIIFSYINVVGNAKLRPENQPKLTKKRV